MSIGTTMNATDHRHLWFDKPRLYRSNTGWWCCRTQEDGKPWYLIGRGFSPEEAFEDMKKAIVHSIKREYGASAVDFV